MSTSIESLELQIKSSSQDAVNGIEALATSLGKLKAATSGGLGLNSVAKNLTSIKTAVDNMGNITNKLSGFSRAIQTLSNLGNIKVSASIGNQITKIGTALSTLDIGNGADKIQELVTALKPLETLDKSSLGTTVNALNKLPEAIQKIDMRKLHGQVDALTRTFRPLAEEMQKIANGFNAFPSRIQKLIKENEKLSNSNKKTKTSFVDLWSKMRMAYNTIKTGATLIGKSVNESMDYTENVNLFNVSMGKYAGEARAYAEQVGEIMGIDPGEWMRNQGVFMTLATGFGVAGDRANKMSKNLTQLGYDISSLFNMSYEDAMLKLQSGLAGELEPLRRIGYDLSQTRLQQEAYTLGINKKISAMTQAEKAELRYHAIMTQVTTSHQDMARTLDAPANQMRVLKSQIKQASRAIGNIFIPILQVVLPYCIAFAKAVRLVANELAKLMGYKEITADLSGMDSLASGADDYSDALSGAADNAKKLKQYTMGFDELNVIDPNKGSGSDSGAGIGGSGFDFELPEYDFLGEQTQNKVNELVEGIKENFGTILGLVGGIGLGLLAWKFSKSFLTGLSMLTTALGVGILIDSIMLTFKEGLSWKSVIEGAIGGALIGAGLGFKFGGWKGALGGIIIGIGVSLVINGITGMFADGVQTEDVVSLIAGALTTVGGIITVIKLFNSKNKSPVPEVETATKTIEETSQGMSKTTSKLKDLVKNLALGIAIIAEVVVASALIVGGIWLLGWELEQVGKAWQPVIDNGATIAIAIGIGTALLVGIGVAAFLLGTATTGSGGTIAAAIGIGMAMMLEIGAATALFLAEIWVVGKLLDEIGKAWQPVLDNGKTIAKGIGIGTGLLVGIGVVTAALGAATVASAGSLPLAIGLGTAILLELGGAFVLFCDSLIAVANKLGDDLHPALKDLNAILPDLNDNMEDFTGFMGDFAEMTVEYTKNSAISGFSATVDSIVKFFTKDPIKALADNVGKQYDHSVKLNEKLALANPELETAISGLKTYKERVDSLKFVADTINTNDLGVEGFTNLVTIGGKISAFGSKMKEYYNKIKDIKVSVMDNMVSCVNDVIDFAVRIKNEVDTTAIDNFTEAINNLTTAIKNLPTSKTVTIKAIYESSGTSPQKFATGGFPETGQMFIAREAGAEMVGNIGRRTAVANNDQIVAGIASGVAEANNESNALLREQNSLLRAMLEKESGVYLDGKSITKSVEKHQRERGRVLVTGGAY